MKNLIKIYIGIAIFIGFLYAEKASEIELIPVYEKTYNKEAINVIYDTIVVSGKEAKKLGVEIGEKENYGKIRLAYPKVIIIPDENDTIGEKNLAKEILFLDKYGKIKKKIPLQRWILGKQSPAAVSISPNNKYICVATPFKYPAPGISLKKFVIYDIDGNELWSVEDTIDGAYVSPNGKYIIGSIVEFGKAPVVIHYFNGKVKKIKKDNRIYEVKFSKNGSFFALYIETISTWESEARKHTPRYVGNLVVIDDKGNELWRKSNVPFGKINVEDEKIILTVIRVSNFLDEKGEWRRKEQKIKEYHFDKKGNLIYFNQIEEE